MGQEVPATSDDLTATGALPPAEPDDEGVRPEDSASAFVRNTAVMAVGTGLSRITGFARVAAMAFALGITESRLADAFNIANTTPNIVYELVLGGVLSSVLVPVFVEWIQTRGRAEAWEVARRLLTIAFVSLSAVALACIVAAPWIADLYTLRYGPGQEAARELATFLLRWFMPQVVFYGIGAVAIGLLNAERRFAAPAFAPILNNLVAIATFVLFAAMPGPAPGSGELATGAQRLVLGVGTTLGVAAMTFAVWPALRRTGFRFAWRPGWRHAAIGRIARLAGWVVVYVVANQVGYLVVIVLAGGNQGDYAAYATAFILFQLPHAIFTVSIVTALLPAMSSRWTDGDVAGMRALVARGIRATAVIVLPAAAAYIVIGRDIVRVLFEHGVAGTSESGDRVAEVLALFSLGLFFFSTFQLALRAFYAMQDTRTPALVNIGSLGVNVGVNLVLVLVLDLGVRGLALGHAASYLFSASVALAILRRRLGRLEGRSVARTIVRTLIATALSASAAWVVARAMAAWLGTDALAAQVLQVTAAVGAGIGTFLLGALILRIEEVDTVERHLLARWRR